MSQHNEAHADGNEHEEHHEHVTSLAFYTTIFITLLCLTGLTVWVAQFDFGVLNTPIAMLVATVKASLVALFFMHLLHDERMNSLVMVFGLFFVALFFGFTILDIVTRTYIDPVRANGGVAAIQVAGLEVELEGKGDGIPDVRRPRYDIAAVDERVYHKPESKKAKPKAPKAELVIPTDLDQALVAKGKELFTQKTCSACHSITGARLVGPTMKGAWGRVEQLEGGSTATIDAVYFKESIQNPGAKVVKGFPPAMPPLALSDGDINALAEYVRSLGIQPGKAAPKEEPKKVESRVVIPTDLDPALVAKGKALYTAKTCSACHSITGARLVGPTMKAAWGRVETLEDGSTVTIDGAYFKESVQTPKAKLVKGYPPSMPPLGLSDAEIEALAAYVKSLGVHVSGEPVKAVPPPLDTDKDGILDVDDKCPKKPETKNGFQDEDGCPDVKKVTITAERVEIPGSVQFMLSKDALKKESILLLNDIAEVLKAHPEISRIEIQGHTDSTGNAAKNKTLSKKRADRVMKYFTRRGISRRRFKAVGFGGEKPIADNETDFGRARNRRVDFVILERDPTKALPTKALPTKQ